ncbi:MAG: ABC transporter permease [Acidimicrobiales bacterium]
MDRSSRVEILDSAGGLDTLDIELPAAPHADRSRRLLLLWARELATNRYYRTRLGMTWLIVEPVVSALVFWFAFQVLLDRDSAVEGAPFILSFLVASVPYNYFQQTVHRGSTAIAGNLGLLSYFVFRRELLVYAIALSGLVELAVGIGIVVAAFVIGSQGVAATAPLALLVLIPLILLTLGMALGFAALSAWTGNSRDVPILLGIGLRGLFFMSAVIFPIEAIPEKWQFAYLLNPLAAMNTSIRDLVFVGHIRFGGHLLFALALSAIAFASGLFIFRLRSPMFGD